MIIWSSRLFLPEQNIANLDYFSMTCCMLAIMTTHNLIFIFNFQSFVDVIFNQHDENYCQAKTSSLLYFVLSTLFHAMQVKTYKKQFNIQILSNVTITNISTATSTPTVFHLALPACGSPFGSVFLNPVHFLSHSQPSLLISYAVTPCVLIAFPPCLG